MLPLAVLAGVLAALPSASIPVAARPDLQVQIEVEPDVDLASDDLQAIADEVRRIWAPVLDVHMSLPAEVRRPMALDTIRLTVTAAPSPSSEATALGWIEFVNGDPSPSMKVSVNAARQIASRGSWMGKPLSSLPPRTLRTFVQRALARAAAHEMGHYLLRSTSHERKGLMRSAFTVEEIMDGRAALVRLTADEVVRLRERRTLIANRTIDGPVLQ